MNKRLEDKIAMLAFGELSDKEAAEVRAVAAGDPEAAKLLKSYESMRSDFRSMSDSVPPDQLSKERLQDAILKQGLREKEAQAPRRWFGWVLAPAALTLLAAMVFVMRGGEEKPGDVTVGLNDPAPSFKIEDLQREAGDINFGKSPVEAVAKSAGADVRSQPAPVETVNATRSVASASHGRRSSAVRRSSRSRPLSDSDRSNETELAVLPPTEDSRVSFATRNPNVSQSKVILIQNVRDDSTGALKAVETEAYQGVLIGS